MTEAIRIEGPLQVEAVERTVSDIVRRHEVLRTRFEARNGAPVQVIDVERVPTERANGWCRKWYFIFALYCIAFGLVYYLVSFTMELLHRIHPTARRGVLILLLLPSIRPLLIRDAGEMEFIMSRSTANKGQ